MNCDGFMKCDTWVYIIISHRHFKCSIIYAKRYFHRSINDIFGKIGRLASEEVLMELIKRKCIPLAPQPGILLLNYGGYKSLDFTIIRFLMKHFLNLWLWTSLMSVYCTLNFHYPVNWFKKERGNLWPNLLIVSIYFGNLELTLFNIL